MARGSASFDDYLASQAAKPAKKKEDTHTYKIGTTKTGKRIWIEGGRLLDHGFKHKLSVKREWSKGKLVLSIVDAKTAQKLERHERGSVAGSPDRPIIDITSSKIAETFAGTHVDASFKQGVITITSGKAARGEAGMKVGKALQGSADFNRSVELEAAEKWAKKNPPK